MSAVLSVNASLYELATLESMVTRILSSESMNSFAGSLGLLPVRTESEGEMSGIKQRLKEMAKTVGENCPYVFARHLGIRFTYTDLLGDIVGLYKEIVPGEVQLFIGTGLDPERQDNVVYDLIVHHIEHPGVTKTIVR